MQLRILACTYANEHVWHQKGMSLQAKMADNKSQHMTDSILHTVLQEAVLTVKITMYPL